MHRIRVRTATGAEESFASRDQLSDAIAAGRIGSDWEVFHLRGNRWLPVTVHPAWPKVATVQAEVAPHQSRRSSDLVLIYPDFTPSPDPVQPPAIDADPFATGPILTPEVIHRVLRAPRPSDRHAATAMAAPRGAGVRSSGPQDRPLLEKAMPTFSRALHAAADLVQTKL